MKKILILLFIICLKSVCQTDEVNLKLVGGAYLENSAYTFLEKLCDEAGGRLPGSESNNRAVQMLYSELKNSGIAAEIQEFSTTGWIRGDDVIEMVQPVKRKLRANPLYYVDSCPEFTAKAIYFNELILENLNTKDIDGKIVFIFENALRKIDTSARYQIIEIFATHKAKAVFFVMEKNGGIVISSCTNFSGKPTSIPSFWISYEEGLWVKRLCDKGQAPELRIKVNSYCTPIRTANVIATIPGKVKDKIVLGGHIDSWDLGQGAIDNGQGTAVLLDVAKLLQKYSPNNYYTIEIVWFNGEETGLLGSYYYCKLKKDSIKAMVNADMPGRPTGFNTMGFDEFKPFFNDLIKLIAGFTFKDGIAANPWVNSDHFPFMNEGIPSFTLFGFMEKDMYWYYHDFGDSFDKVDKGILSDASAVLSVMLKELANRTDLPFKRYSKSEMKEFWIKHNLDKQLKRQLQWDYSE